jgi:hypothetical protein
LDFWIDLDFTTKENFGDGVEGGVKKYQKLLLARAFYDLSLK